MVPAKEAKEILYNMFAQNFVTITVSSAVSVLLYSTCRRELKCLETCASKKLVNLQDVQTLMKQLIYNELGVYSLPRHYCKRHWCFLDILEHFLLLVFVKPTCGE